MWSVSLCRLFSTSACGECSCYISEHLDYVCAWCMCVHRHTHVYARHNLLTRPVCLWVSHIPPNPLSAPHLPRLGTGIWESLAGQAFLSPQNILLLILSSAVTGMGLGDILTLHPPPTRRTPCPFCLLVTELKAYQQNSCCLRQG